MKKVYFYTHVAAKFLKYAKQVLNKFFIIRWFGICCDIVQ